MDVMKVFALLFLAILTTYSAAFAADKAHYQPIECRAVPLPEREVPSYKRYPNGGPREIGIIGETVEGAWIRRLNKETGEFDAIKAKPGMRVYVNDTLRTPHGVDGIMTVETYDHGIMRMADNADVYIQNYVIEDSEVNHASVSVASGWMRFKGKHAIRYNTGYEFHLPTMTIGIRGTEGIIYASSGITNDLYLTEGKVDICRRQKGDGKIQEIVSIEADENGEFVRVSTRDIRRNDTPPKGFLERRVPPSILAPMVRKYDFSKKITTEEPTKEIKQYADKSRRHYKRRPWMDHTQYRPVPKGKKYYTGSMAIKHGWKPVDE